MLFAHPFDYLVSGYCCDSSGFDASRFCVPVFVQALYVPFDGVIFTLGGRLGTLSGKAERWWELRGDNEQQVMEEIYDCIVKEGKPFLDRLATLSSFVENAGTITNHTGVLQRRAYGAILLGDQKMAEKLLDRHEKEIQSYGPLRDWEVTELERTRLVRRTFQENPQVAVKLLNGWRDETVKNLRLTKFTEPMSGSSF